MAICKRKFSKLIESLLIRYGVDSPHGRCSHRYLAKIINPKSPPVNAIGDWLRMEREPRLPYIARIAEMIGMTTKELQLYLNNNKEYARTLDFTDLDVKECELVLLKIATGVRVTPEEVEDASVTIENLDIKRLLHLRNTVEDTMQDYIASNPKLIMMHQMGNQLTDQMLRKLSIISGEEKLVS